MAPWIGDSVLYHSLPRLASGERLWGHLSEIGGSRQVDGLATSRGILPTRPFERSLAADASRAHGGGFAATAILSGRKEVPATHLRKITLEELERRNYSETTTRAYLHTIEDFARHFNRPPDQLGPEEIREFTAHMFHVRKLADNTVGQRVAALRFFFTKTHKRSWNIEETPYPKKRTQLPVILSQDEVARLIEAASSPFHHTILMTLYGTGVRRAELTHLFGVN